jgi:hypothetical protein
MSESTNAQLQELMEAKIVALDRVTDAKFVTLRTLLDSQAEKVALALDSADKAVTKAETAAEKRFESVNEFRGQLTDQAAVFISRPEYAQALHALEDKIADLKESRDAGLGGSDMSTKIIATAIAVLGSLVGLAGLALAIISTI